VVLLVLALARPSIQAAMALATVPYTEVTEAAVQPVLMVLAARARLAIQLMLSIAVEAAEVEMAAMAAREAMPVLLALHR
jgi:hypothetical protein